MSITDRLSPLNRLRETGSLDDQWTRRQTSPFGRGAGTLSLGGQATFEQLSRELALDKETLALVLGMSDLMLEGWQRGIQQPAGSSMELLDRVRRLHRRLYALRPPHEALNWLRAPNEHLHFQAPVDILIGGGLHRVEAALDHLEATAE